MKAESLLLLAAGAVALFVLARPKIAAASTVPVTAKTPGTAAISQISADAIKAGTNVATQTIDRIATWLSPSRPSVSDVASGDVTFQASNGLSLYDF